MLTIAERYKDVSEYYFSRKLREVNKLQSEGKEIINLGIGSPDLMPPMDVIQELIKVARLPNIHGYQSYKGLPELRSSFANWYADKFNAHLNPDDNILPLIGSKEGITYISNTYLNPGDEVLIPDPGYPTYAAATKAAGALPVYYALDEEQNWRPNIEVLKKRDLSKVKIMWINYPHMPSGARLDREGFNALIRFAEENDILLCHDNPYSFILNDNPISILGDQESLSKNVLELNSLSKSHNMAGWRVGLIAGHADHINNILMAKSNVDSGMYYGIQKAAIAALRQPHSWYDQLNGIYHSRREIVWKIMDSLDCKYDKNQSGLFIWGKMPSSTNDVEAFVDELLYEVGVFITPGFIFGSNGARYIRISLCASNHVLQKALNQIEKKNQNLKTL